MTHSSPCAKCRDLHLVRGRLVAARPVLEDVPDGREAELGELPLDRRADAGQRVEAELEPVGTRRTRQQRPPFRWVQACEGRVAASCCHRLRHRAESVSPPVRTSGRGVSRRSRSPSRPTRRRVRGAVVRAAGGRPSSGSRSRRAKEARPASSWRANPCRCRPCPRSRSRSSSSPGLNLRDVSGRGVLGDRCLALCSCGAMGLVAGRDQIRAGGLATARRRDVNVRRRRRVPSRRRSVPEPERARPERRSAGEHRRADADRGDLRHRRPGEVAPAAAEQAAEQRHGRERRQRLAEPHLQRPPGAEDERLDGAGRHRERAAPPRRTRGRAARAGGSPPAARAAGRRAPRAASPTS